MLHLGRAVCAQVYFEAKVTDEGLCRVGWAARSAGLELGTDKQVPLTTVACKRVSATEAARQLSSGVTKMALFNVAVAPSYCIVATVTPELWVWRHRQEVLCAVFRRLWAAIR